MSELISFKYINDSLTTMAQVRLIGKLASYFKIPQKTMREALDKNRLKTIDVVSFDNYSLPEHANGLIDEFYVTSFEIDVNDFLNHKRFVKSRFVAEYTLMLSDKRRGSPYFVVYDKDLYILLDFPNSVEGGGFFINYPDFDKKILIPLQFWLETEHPLPSL